jgi:hypothetical protein
VIRRLLTDRAIRALKPAPEGTRYEVFDSIVPGMAIRVTERGVRTFVLVARYPHSPNPTRRSLGQYGAITLDAARDKARAWLGLIKAGRDPHDELERQRAADEQLRANTFVAVAERFIHDKVKGGKQRKGKETERDIRRVALQHDVTAAICGAAARMLPPTTVGGPGNAGPDETSCRFRSELDGAYKSAWLESITIE